MCHECDTLGRPYQRAGADLFAALVDIPLSLWYLTFYSNPTTKYVVIGKILVDSFHATGQAYGEYIVNYLYYEEPLTEEEVSLYEEISLVQKKKNGYDNSSLLNVLAYHIFYLIICPFIGIYEMGVAGMNAFRRDFTCLTNKVHTVTKVA